MADTTTIVKRLPRRARDDRASALPLSEFPEFMQREIAEAVAQPKPPEQWLPIGPGGLRPLALLPSRAWYEWHWERGIDPDARRGSLPPSLRTAVIERDGMTCGLCGDTVESLADIHIDHIKPVVHGGSDHISNLQVAHSRCNLRKGARV